MHHEFGLINHTSHPHICGNKVYNIGQKIGLWLGPHYIIAEMDCASKDSKKPVKKSGGGAEDNIVGSAKNRKDGAADYKPSYKSEYSTRATSSQSDNNNSGVGGKSSKDLGSPKRRSASTSSSGFASSKKRDWSPWSTAKVVATIPSRWPFSICYMHSFCVTQNYFVLVEQPFAIIPINQLINQLCGEKPIASCLRYYPEEDTLFHVISRHPAKSSSKGRRVFRAPSFFFLHTINAFEMRDVDTADTFVIVDICCYDDPAMIDCMYVDALKVRQFYYVINLR